ncbi:hypothetical protein RclHR1_32220001 [Rhizophagus clarus]|uniref:Uncharacterized protein n=1 Tax=Rhizophagus clarus TaxID=94130 RepID=A0A2Z6RBQ5_9GLOM|nr:hypothetical protein RclHR1_32220001 [Rhizophagus clarus]GES90960.1 hypothetical protein GLOIN_2v1777449 [Rhizophagus clarus]
MTKTSLKQKYRKRNTLFIYSNIDTNNSKSHRKINIGGKDSNNILTIVKPTFPSTLIIDDLITSNNTNDKPKSLPNAFIAYRMALMKEYRIKNCKLPPMSEVSIIASNSWNTEPKHVKDFYKSLVKDAKSIYKQNNIQIVLDKHMNYVENNQTYDTVINENPQVQNSVDAENFPSSANIFTDISLNNSTSINTSYDMNSTLNDREYIKVLEQIIDCLLN